MSKTKKLKLLQIEQRNLDNAYLIHYDHKDNLLAKEHMGQYLIANLSRKSSKRTNRIYLSYEPHKEYFELRKKEGEILRGISARPNDLHLLDHFQQYTMFIQSVISTAVPYVMSIHLTEDFLRGLGICLLIFDYLDITLTCINELTNKIQKKVIDNIHQVTKVKNNRNMLRYFFGTVEKYIHGFVAIDIPTSSTIDKSIEAYPSSVIYQMDYYARKELKRLKERHLEYKEWHQELNTKDLFLLENLACTYYNPNQISRPFKRQINHISKTLYKINLKCWDSQHNDQYIYNSNDQKQQHHHLLELSQNGIDIEINNEKMFALWVKTLQPGWPVDQTINKKYKDIYTDIGSFHFRMMRKINLDYHEFKSRIYPGFNEIYPLILLILIREGINSEVLQEWKITKTDEGYRLGDRSVFAIVIDAEKTRANSIITTTISKDSEQAQYIEFYTQWLSDIYEKSNDNYFFQHSSRGSKTLSWLGSAAFSRMNRTDNSFYKKYKIFNIDGKRILHVNHKKIRVNSNYMDYLRGLNEFERQLKKGHNSIDTQKKYENSKEWKDQVMLKISKTQNQYVSFFRGQTLESTNKVGKLFEGVLSDCSNPTSPDYPGYKSLKPNEACTDWFKCLTGCTKANVIKPIHGPAIVAWKEYMEKQQELFFRIEDWEKEYLSEYEAAISVLENFNEGEIQFAIENAHNYIDVVKMKFSNKVKLTQKRSQGEIHG